LDVTGNSPPVIGRQVVEHAVDAIMWKITSMGEMEVSKTLPGVISLSGPVN
jgi:hypothetical protein